MAKACAAAGAKVAPVGRNGTQAAAPGGDHPGGGDVTADACVFLLSNKSLFVTGHIMHAGGGAGIVFRRTGMIHAMGIRRIAMTY